MATIQNLVIDQGATFSRTFDLTDADGAPYDLSAYTIVAQVRRGYSSNTGLQFTSAIEGLAENGSITISLTAAETLSLRYGRYVYDIKLISSTEQIRVVEGIVTITPTVTR